MNNKHKSKHSINRASPDTPRYQALQVKLAYMRKNKLIFTRSAT